MTTFTSISDTHGRYLDLPEIPEADIIIHAGDCTNTGTIKQIREFCEWYGSLPHEYKILIAGNHDWGFQDHNKIARKICKENGIIYLQDEYTTIKGIKIHGSPQTPEFCNWAFNCWKSEFERDSSVFPEKYELIEKYWDMIDKDVDILVTHGPAYKIMDECPNGYRAGCELLLKKIQEIKPKFHICGHIHGGRGHELDSRVSETFFINAASLGEDYKPFYFGATVFDFENKCEVKEDKECICCDKEDCDF